MAAKLLYVLSPGRTVQCCSCNSRGYMDSALSGCISWTWLKNWRPPQWTTVSDQIGCRGVGGGALSH